MIKLQTAFPALSTEASAHQKLLERFQKTIKQPDVGFFSHTSDKGVATLAKTTARRFAHKKLLVHVGIGGSALGPEMLLSALGVETGKRVQFLNNIDPDMLARQMKEWSVGETFFYVVSKSGTTAETFAALSIIGQWLARHGVAETSWKEHVVLCTDPVKGDLRTFAREHHLACLDVPSSVGGRYSVLTDVGLFPAAWAGVNIDQLVQGAEAIRPLLLNPAADKNILTATALWLHSRQQEGRSITVLMPYSSLLKDFCAWWVQLWAESLGKEGKGLTPVGAYGATDQHSQMQLFMQGPADKAMLVIGVTKHVQEFALANPWPYATFKKLSPYGLAQLLNAEREGTLQALQEAQRPYLSYAMADISPGSVGGLILFLESLTVAVGLLLEIDPFNQPGVEAGKKHAWEWLSHKRS